jgi:hypothetical protein
MRRSLPFAALLTIAAAIRIFLNDVTAYQPYDEAVYLRYTQVLAGGGSYARIVRMFIDDRSMWVFPNPLRWAYLGATTLFCHIGDACSFRTLATLSTVAGIAVVALTYVLGVELFERTTALFAAALVATSPLQLHLGRRALSDEFFCAMVLASIVAIRRPWVWVIVTTLAFGAKEQFVFIYPVVLLFWWLRERKLRWEWLLPPVLFFGVFCLLARDVTSFFRIARIITSVMNAPYAVQSQSGPPQRLLIDFLAVAPLVTIAFLIAAYLRRREPLVVLAVGILVVHSFISSKNLRYVVTADPLMRLAVASVFPRKTFLAVNAVIELVLFHFIFIVNGVYDPVTHELLRALKIVPV